MKDIRMDKKVDIKKILKLCGNIISIIALLFVGKKLFTMEIDTKLLFSARTLGVFVVLVLIQVFIILTSCFPWLKFVQILSGKNIKFKESMIVYAKANIYKYIPGNVFQFVARNELAVKAEVSHVDVAASTLLDTMFSLGMAFLISIVLLKDIAFSYLKDYGDIFGKIIIIGAVCIVLLAAAVVILRKKLAPTLKRYRDAVRLKNLLPFAKLILYYVFSNLLNSIMLVILLHQVFRVEMDFGQLLTLVGAYLLSIIIGMVTPGASGGIGIREAVMLFLSQNLFTESVIVSAMVIMRVVSIVADVVAYLFQLVISKVIK